MRIPEDVLQKMNLHKAHRDSLAYKLGVLTVQYRKDEMFLLNSIAHSLEMQRQIGQDALAELGLDESDTHNITDAGDVQVLIDGEYRNL